MDPDRNSFDVQVDGVAALSHPLSRRVHDLVLARGWVSRDAAAEALEVPRSVAAFHLDKLSDAGLLRTRYERTSGRTGPGAGRPAKLYGRSDLEIDLSLPPRRYDLAGLVLADALDRAAAEGGAADQVVQQVAREAGVRLGDEAAHASGGSPPRAAVLDMLGSHGYEPQERGDEITLRNCPFHRLAQEHRTLVCGMNRDLLAGVLAGVGMAGTFSARLAPEPGYCCVRLEMPDAPARP